MGIKLSDIEQRLREINVEPNPQGSVWGFIMPTVGSMILYGHMSALVDMKCNLLHFTSRGIVMIPFNNLGKMQSEYRILSKDQIKHINIKKGIMGYIFIIETVEGNLKFRVSKINIGYKWHKENLRAILASNFSYMQ